jgi:hypothetical protein
MHLARLMQRSGAERQLRQRRAQPRFIVLRTLTIGTRAPQLLGDLGRDVGVGGRRQLELLVERRGPGPRVREQVPALDQLHGVKPVAVFADQLAQAHQVRVRQIGERAELALEAPQVLRIERAQRLERNARTALVVPRLVDHAHTARPQPALDGEALGAGELARKHR